MRHEFSVVFYRGLMVEEKVYPPSPAPPPMLTGLGLVHTCVIWIQATTTLVSLTLVCEKVGSLRFRVAPSVRLLDLLEGPYMPTRPP